MKIALSGFASNLAKRAYEHKHGLADGSSKKYGCKTLVFVEYQTMEFAILREKQIKAGSRKKKIELIEQI